MSGEKMTASQVRRAIRRRRMRESRLGEYVWPNERATGKFKARERRR